MYTLSFTSTYSKLWTGNFSSKANEKIVKARFHLNELQFKCEPRLFGSRLSPSTVRVAEPTLLRTASVTKGLEGILFWLWRVTEMNDIVVRHC